MKFEMIIPERFAGKTLLAEFSTEHADDWNIANPQFKVFQNKELVQGLDVNHREMILCKEAVPGECLVYEISVYSGMDDAVFPVSLSYGQFDALVDKVIYDLQVPMKVMVELHEGDERRIRIGAILERAVNILDFRDSRTSGKMFRQSLREASLYLDDVFYKKAEDMTGPAVYGIGHTHIDVAWLWTAEQTREKAARSFTNALRLMERYPEYRFFSSQPQLYEYVKEDYPGIFRQIKRRVEEGRWEADGGMWLEADCNLTSGESLVRQLYYGKKFFREEFGKECEVLWLPDAFGFSGALPQILNKSGIKYFMTAKICWNEYNRLPYDMFEWHGIDDSSVLAYIITSVLPKEDMQGLNEGFPISTYNGFLQPDVLIKTYERFQQKELSDTVLLPYGYGDGGGGTTDWMLEYGRRLEKGISGCPKFQFSSISGFTELLEEKRKEACLPQWVGELYLEYHRGTYTSRAKTKKYNRRAESLLSEAEFHGALASALSAGYQYPHRRMEQMWKTVLRNQFHDILPGTSIQEVYEVSDMEYKTVFQCLGGIKSEALEEVAALISTDGHSLAAFHASGSSCPQITEAKLPDWCSGIMDERNVFVPAQPLHSGNALVLLEGLPSFGYRTYRLAGKEEAKYAEHQVTDVRATTAEMENQYWKISLDTNGVITGIYDKKEKREVLKKGGKGNQLLAFEDMPHNFDAWDITEYYRQKMWEINEAESISVTENGPLRWTIEITRKYQSSCIVQKMHMYHVLPYIEFETWIDWHEEHTLLKTSFDVDIHSDYAAYDIQFGCILRPTHSNTSWDAAKFEVCGQKWADLSEYGYGAAILNDCKYGYDIHRGDMRLTLLKSATYPNAKADQGEHTFRYAFYPHAGDWREAGVIPYAKAFNQTVFTQLLDPQEGKIPGRYSIVKAQQNNIVIETVKKAEGREGILVRFYEAFNRRCKAEITFGSCMKEVWECDLMENLIQDMESNICCGGNSLWIDVRPFEIKTLYVVLDLD